MGLGFVLVPGSAISQGKSLKEQLVGTWEGVSIVLTRSDGTKIHPFGEKLNGSLIFTADGHSVVLLTRSDLPKIAANNRLGVTPDEAQAAYRGSYGYFGPYTVNEAEKSFTTKVLGSTYPNEVGANTKRVVTSISADELKFTNAAGAGGGSVEATFRHAK
jgi:hypothetical protein